MFYKNNYIFYKFIYYIINFIKIHILFYKVTYHISKAVLLYFFKFIYLNYIYLLKELCL